MKKSVSLLTLFCLFTLSVFMTAHCRPAKADTVEGISNLAPQARLIEHSHNHAMAKTGAPYATPKPVYFSAINPDAHTTAEVRQAYINGGYDPDNPESVRKADLDTYYNHKEEIDEAWYASGRTDDPERFFIENLGGGGGGGGNTNCQYCGCHMYWHYGICYNGLSGLGCYTHWATICWWWW